MIYRTPVAESGHRWLALPLISYPSRFIRFIHKHLGLQPHTYTSDRIGYHTPILYKPNHFPPLSFSSNSLNLSTTFSLKNGGNPNIPSLVTILYVPLS